ncbi:olfactory receptor 2AT4-like [Sarcophilus harrisii]|uniref:G-protein coupled receptors family 1 profile domain-containing protein n=1 Tax=Sarcophilus harrisii TaxID=9305 RepID=G3VMQ5_SARHA|nr:olfactory receptor 2AT4-like [Sarcophilus harrisii]
MVQCNNQSTPPPVTVFVLLGFPALQEAPLPLFFIFLALYTLIVLGNVVILVAVVGDPRLHKPMYFFLCNLSALDILFTTTTVPKMLAMFLFQHNAISFAGCFLQMYSFHTLTVMESFILVVMAYDRYEAICHPLHYPSRMTPQANASLAAGAWTMALIIPAPVIVETAQLEYTARALVEHCFCDHLAVVRAACQDAGSKQQTFIGFCIAMTVSLVPLLLVLFSYGRILVSVVKIASQEGRTKAFSTCTSHLLVVGTYYSSIAVAYVSYRMEMAIDLHVLSNVIFAILTPMLNPLIYTLRNKDVKEAIKTVSLKVFLLLKNF